MEIFDGGPGDGETVVGGGAAANFVQQDERARSCGVQNRGRLRHLDPKRGAAAGEIVAGPDASKDAVDYAEARRTCGNE